MCEHPDDPRRSFRLSPGESIREALSFPKLFKCVGIQQNGDFLGKLLLG